MRPHKLLLESFKVALAAADPLRVVPPHLPKPSRLFGKAGGRTLVIGAGKAAAAMALVVENYWPQNARLDGIALTRYDHGLPLQRIKLIEAGHPLPDEKGERAAQAILAEVKKLSPDDFLLCLLSGGGSSLLSLPLAGVTLNDIRTITGELLRCGAAIQEINTVRKHLSAILGGRLAASCQAGVLALIISDVAGDDPTHVASGPCAPDPSTYHDALAILEYYGVTVPPAVVEVLLAGAQGKREETPKPGNAVFSRVETRIIASGHHSLMAAAEYFRAQGIPSAVLGDSITGEAREVAKVIAGLVKEIRHHGQPWKPPVALISGGETTVTLRRGEKGENGKNGGRGGRNTEFLLSLAIELDGVDNVFALACDSDGIDGTESNAGAIVLPDTLRRARQRGVDPSVLLAANKAYDFFQQLDDLVITGPTRTNVNDYRAVLIL